MNQPAYILIIVLFSTGLISCKTEEPADKKKDTEILKLIEAMSLEEKVSMVHGENANDPDGIAYVGYLPGIPRLGIPPIAIQNGPSGAGATFSVHRHLKPATAFPVPVAQASTWNTELLYRVGKVLGTETKAQGRNVIAAPTINIIRVPEGGRNFEMFSEDPYLSARCGVNLIKGIQEMGTMADAKHLVANNQESWRHTIDEAITERALREIYLPAFEAAVKEAEVSSLMAAYNKINGTYCTESKLVLNDIVKEEWGFMGFIMTDWGTFHKTVPAVHAGLDMEMSGWGKFGDPQFKIHLAEAVRNGEIEESALEDMVYRILHEMKRFGHIGKGIRFPDGQMNTKEHQNLALQVALECAVLLKNDNHVLPLDPESIKKVALFGRADTSFESGGGSSNVVPFYKVSPLEGISKRMPDAEVKHYPDHRSAGNADVAIIYISEPSSESSDRTSVSLAGQGRMIEEISEKYEKTIVMLRTPGAYIIPWIDQVDAVFQMWFPGQEEGNAEAALLFGDVSPSGKLPVTFGKERKDFPATSENEFPGIAESVSYAEGIFVGYRYFEHFGTNILFPFGHGLSYTDFAYGNLVLSSNTMQGDDILHLSYTITNSGEREAAEVSQLYIQDVESSVERPVKELKGFNKLFLQPGESQTVELSVNKRDLSFWDPEADKWTAEPGEFRIMIGASSSDIRLAGSFMYK